MPEFASVSDLALVIGIFAIGVASPGPATLMIVKTAAERGRVPALVFSAGVICGSVFWGILAGMGFVTMLQTSATWLTALRIAGGLYLLFMAYRSVKAALSIRPVIDEPLDRPRSAPGEVFLKGLLLHLTNPKAPLVWLATLSIGAHGVSSPAMMVTTIAACAVASLLIFSGYAVLFSTGAAMNVYQAARRPINLIAGTFFGLVGVKLLTSRSGVVG